MHCFFSGTCFHTAGSARSTRALALRSPKPKRLLTMSPAPFLFQPGLLAKGSNSEVQTTMCCRSLQVRSGLRQQTQTARRFNETCKQSFVVNYTTIDVRSVLVVVSYFCSRARANIPAARGAEADVPVCVWVHSLWRSALV